MGILLTHAHCHLLVDKHTGRFKSRNVCKLITLMPLLCLVVAHKQRFSEDSPRKRNSCLIASRSQRAGKCCDFNWMLLWVVTENTQTAPSPLLHQIRVRRHSPLCIPSVDLACDGFIRSKPAGASRIAPPFLNQYTHGRNYKICGRSRASGGIKVVISFIISLWVFCCALGRGAHVSSARSDWHQQIVFLLLHPVFIWCWQPSSRLATSFTFSFSVRLGYKDAFGDVRSATF